MREELGSSFSRTPDVIPIGVDTALFRPSADRRSRGRAIGLGIVRPFKRWELAAEALRGTGLGLTIVGPTPDPAYAAKVVAAGDRVALAGEGRGAALVRRPP